MLPLLLAIGILVLDQWTKHSVRADFRLGESIPVIDGFFNLTYVRNTGAAWGMLGGQNTVLTLLSLVMLGVMLVYRRSFLNDTLEHRVALGLLIGGILGNLMDRIRQGWVTDFFDFYIGNAHWPCFNIADAAICTGVGIYLLSALWIKRHPLKSPADEARMDAGSMPSSP
ncbi:MAG: signal peptidase II [Kiritimatiellae bacterium]|nr:signal peptidase II [Kiritimatiellia bacterium]MCB1100833.1 signal peptidase II [Kiritimatiellia bacterium]